MRWPEPRAQRCRRPCSSTASPPKALVKAAEDRSADLIVMGAVHDRSLAGRLLGTTAEEVTKKATCDVLIVRPVDRWTSSGARGVSPS